jgi:hypothetical protein
MLPPVLFWTMSWHCGSAHSNVPAAPFEIVSLLGRVDGTESAPP